MILVTGASGFIGRSLMQLMRAEEHPIAAYKGRMNDPLTMRRVLPGVTTVVHLAGSEARGRRRLLDIVDVSGTELLLRECQRAGVQRLIFVSRLNADPNSLYPLLRAKGRVERLLRHSDLPVTIIRSATVFGRDDRFLNVIAGLAAWSWPLIWLPGGGRVPMQPLWVEDLARCLVMVLTRPAEYDGRLIEVAGEERLHYADIVRMVLAVTGLRRLFMGLPIKLIRPLSAILFGWWFRPPVTRFFLDRFSAPEVAPVDTVLRQFGFMPTHLNRQMAFLRRTNHRRRLFRL